MGSEELVYPTETVDKDLRQRRRIQLPKMKRDQDTGVNTFYVNSALGFLMTTSGHDFGFRLIWNDSTSCSTSTMPRLWSSTDLESGVNPVQYFLQHLGWSNSLARLFSGRGIGMNLKRKSLYIWETFTKWRVFPQGSDNKHNSMTVAPTPKEHC